MPSLGGWWSPPTHRMSVHKPCVLLTVERKAPGRVSLGDIDQGTISKDGEPQGLVTVRSCQPQGWKGRGGRCCWDLGRVPDRCSARSFLTVSLQGGSWRNQCPHIRLFHPLHLPLAPQWLTNLRSGMLSKTQSDPPCTEHHGGKVETRQGSWKVPCPTRGP